MLKGLGAGDISRVRTGTCAEDPVWLGVSPRETSCPGSLIIVPIQETRSRPIDDDEGAGLNDWCADSAQVPNSWLLAAGIGMNNQTPLGPLESSSGISSS